MWVRTPGDLFSDFGWRAVAEGQGSAATAAQMDLLHVCASGVGLPGMATVGNFLTFKRSLLYFLLSQIEQSIKEEHHA